MAILGIAGARTRMLSVRCEQDERKPTRLITFLGKGGVGKTFSAVLAAQYFASIGLRTCLAVQSQDSMADFLFGGRLKAYTGSPSNVGNLTAFRIESLKLLTEPLNQLKRADAQMNFSQGALQDAAAEELSVLAGMESLIALGLLEKLTGFARLTSRKLARTVKQQYDVVVYDGGNSDETLRMFGCAERARWYTKTFRKVVEKTDVGRLAMPSVLRLIEASFVEGLLAEGSTSELWDQADTLLQGVAQCFADPTRFSAYIVTDPSSSIVEETALRYWGCAMQAGMHVAGFLHHSYPNGDEAWKDKYMPASVTALPQVSFGSSPDWPQLLSELDDGLFAQGQACVEPVAIDASARTVTCFLPGFNKSEVKLSQMRMSELLLEAGDQRRLVSLPRTMHGKVTGAKLQDKRLVITVK